MGIKIDVEKNAFLEFFPLNLETNSIVLTDELILKIISGKVKC